MLRLQTNVSVSDLIYVSSITAALLLSEFTVFEWILSVLEKMGLLGTNTDDLTKLFIFQIINLIPGFIFGIAIIKLFEIKNILQSKKEKIMTALGSSIGYAVVATASSMFALVILKPFLGAFVLCFIGNMILMFSLKNTIKLDKKSWNNYTTLLGLLGGLLGSLVTVFYFIYGIDGVLGEQGTPVFIWPMIPAAIIILLWQKIFIKNLTKIIENQHEKTI